MSMTRIESDTRALLAELKTVRLETSETDFAKKLLELAEKGNEILKDCSGPVRLGVLGEFSAGKTRLIEALLGLANQLPTGEIPSTGNIAEFHCKAVPGLKQAQFGRFVEGTGEFDGSVPQYEVVFVTRKEGIDFLEHLRLESEGIFTASDAAFRTALQGVPAGDWDRWRVWAKTVFEDARRHELRALAYEAFRFAQAFQACGEAIQGQTLVLTDKSAADASMTLPNTSTGRMIDSILPTSPAVMTSMPKVVSRDLMAKLFPLVRVVKISVGLPEELGRVLQGGGSLPFVLVDCPGLGAEESTLRDKFLCLRELKSVESILIVVDSRRPGSNGAPVLHDMMYNAWKTNISDRILVAFGRFDQLLSDPATRGAAETLSESTEPLTADDLLQQLYDPLGKLVANGRKALADGRLDRVSVVSGNAALWKLKRNHPDLRIGDDSFFDRAFTDDSVQAIQRSADLWSAIGHRLAAAGDHDKPYADWFRDYGADGGLARLKQACRDHMAEHGVKNQENKVESKLLGLQHEKDAFLKILNSRPQRIDPVPTRPGEQPTVDLKDAAFELSQIYFEITSELKNRGVKPLSFTPDGRIDQIDVFEYLREECIANVGDWDEWKLLLDNVDPMRGPGQIMVIEAASETQDVPSASRPRVSRVRRTKTIPTRTDDFYGPFTKTINDLEKLAKSFCKNSVGIILDEHSARVREGLGAKAAAISKEINTPGLVARLGSVDADQTMREQFAVTLTEALSPTAVHDELVSDCEQILDKESANKGEDEDDFMRSIFPLALTSKDGKRIGRVFHWEPEIARKYGGHIVHGRHQIHVIRNRQALEESAVFYIKRVVEGYRRVVATRLITFYAGFEEDLKDLMKSFP